MTLSETYPTQYCCNLRAGLPGSGCRPPGRLRHDSLLEIKSLGRSRHVNLQIIGPLGRLRHVDLLGHWTGRSLSRLRYDNIPETRSLGRSRQVDLLGPPRLVGLQIG